MLAKAATRPAGALLRVSHARLYSSAHGAEKAAHADAHGAHGSAHSAHEHDAHDHGHGHDDHHGPALAPAESIINKNTLTFAGIVALIGGFYTANESYKASNGKSLVSTLAAPIADAQANYDSYRARVAQQTTLQEMLTYPGAKVTADSYIPRDTAVMGRLWASGANTQHNTLRNWEELPPRKTKESPFY